ncbi:MAG: YdcF family protein [Gemmatimonadota bacterium]
MNGFTLETFSLSYFLASFLLPPILLLITASIGTWMLKRSRTGARWLISVSLAGLFVLSLPVVAFSLFKSLEVPPLDPAQAREAQAIVILAGGRARGAIEWGGDTVNAFTLARLRYGAHLARTTGLPVLVTGGGGTDTLEPEAVLMQRVLQQEFGVTPRWVETASRTTAENAALSAAILRKAGITRVLLVTHGFHMQRAEADFERAGLRPIAAPTGFQGLRKFEWLQLVPAADALRLSHVALREWLALERDRLIYRH